MDSWVLVSISSSGPEDESLEPDFTLHPDYNRLYVLDPSCGSHFLAPATPLAKSYGG